jgi:signal transduction histidine kinase
MQQTEQATGRNEAGLTEAGLAETELNLNAACLPASPMDGSGSKRVETVVETLAHLQDESNSLAAVAHDARNMVTALGLYCDLLEEPGVLAPSFHHYAGELRLVATASHRLVEKLLALDERLEPVSSPRSNGSGAARTEAGRRELQRSRELIPAEPIGNLAGEVLANRNLLAALAGPAIALTVDAEGGALPVLLSSEDLTRILVNLVKNAAEAMPNGGRIQISLNERATISEAPTEDSSSAEGKAKAAKGLTLTVEDNGPGIPPESLDKIFAPGYTRRSGGANRQDGFAASHHGLGLAITRSIVEAAGGNIHAVNRTPAGTRFEIELPIRSR